MIPFEEALGVTLRRMGLAEPALMVDITAEWRDVAGATWAARAVPLYIRGGVLVVEAVDRGGVSFLKYGVAELERRLRDRFGPGVIEKVEVRPPQHRQGGGR